MHQSVCVGNWRFWLCSYQEWCFAWWFLKPWLPTETGIHPQNKHPIQCRALHPHSSSCLQARTQQSACLHSLRRKAGMFSIDLTWPSFPLCFMLNSSESCHDSNLKTSFLWPFCLLRLHVVEVFCTVPFICLKWFCRWGTNFMQNECRIQLHHLYQWKV